MENEALNEEPKKTSLRPLVNRMLNHPMGAYRWQKLYDPCINEYIPELYEGGRTDCQVAVDIGISETTFYAWIKEYPAFADAVKYGKAISKASMSQVALDAVYNERKINDKVWHIMMRNCHGYDKTEINPAEEEAKRQNELITNRAIEIMKDAEAD